VQSLEGVTFVNERLRSAVKLRFKTVALQMKRGGYGGCNWASVMRPWAFKRAIGWDRFVPFRMGRESR